MKGVITIAKCSPVTISSSSPVGRVQCTCRQVSDQWRPQTVVSTQLGQLLATVTLIEYGGVCISERYEVRHTREIQPGSQTLIKFNKAFAMEHDR